MKPGKSASRRSPAGVYGLGLSAGRCAYSIARSNAPLGLYAGKWLGLFYGAERLYIDVPEAAQQFTVSTRGARGLGAETVRVNVYDSEGRAAGTGQTSAAREEVSIAVERGSRAPGIWALEVTRADEGTLEDNSLMLSPPLCPVLSLAPEEVFRGE